MANCELHCWHQVKKTGLYITSAAAAIGENAGAGPRDQGLSRGLF